MPKKTVWKGLKDLKAHLRPIESLKPMEGNPKRHSERQLSAFTNALQELGQHRPAVVDKAGVTLIGNGMLEAAQRLGWTHLAVVQSDGKDQLRALTDNSIADLGAWDQEARAQILKDLVDGGEDLRLFGWSKADLDKELQAAMDGLTDDIQDLADAIDAEEPVGTGEDALELAARLSDKISKRLHTIAKEKPDVLTQAQAIVMDRAGGKPLFVLMDPNTGDVITELKRLADDADQIPEGSPLAALMEGMNV
jgi:ParB-like chromosome segregation protein Spo0J